MIYSNKNMGKLFFLFILIVYIVACGQGEQEGLLTDDDFSNRQDFSGNVLSVNKDWLWKLNVSTGQFEKMPNTNWEDNEYYHNLASFLLRPSTYDGNEYILRVRNCFAANNRSSCIAILDENAIKTNEFELEGRISGYAKFSRDRQYIALSIQYGGSITNDTYLEIYDRDGNLISEKVIHTNFARVNFDWLPDGRLVYSINTGEKRTLYFTSPNALDVERVLSLPTGVEGTIGEFSINPDGTQIALDVVDSASFAATVATPWVVNIDGSNLHQLATDPHATGTRNSYINNPKWSPDGLWILLKYGGSNGGSIDNPGGLGYLFAVPSDGVRVPLSPYDASIASTAIQIKSNWYSSFYDRQDSPTDKERWPDMDYDWVSQ